MKKNNQTDSKIFSRLVKYALPLKNAFIISFLLMIISVGLNSVIPLVNAQMLALLGEKEINQSLFVQENFKKDFKGEIIKLNNSYRSSKQIFEFLNCIIKNEDILFYK